MKRFAALSELSRTRSVRGTSAIEKRRRTVVVDEGVVVHSKKPDEPCGEDTSDWGGKEEEPRRDEEDRVREDGEDEPEDDLVLRGVLLEVAKPERVLADEVDGEVDKEWEDEEREADERGAGVDEEREDDAEAVR